jgi:hypothetical protein
LRPYIEGVPLLTLENQIVILKMLQQHIIAWYHLYLKHPGQNRMENTLKKCIMVEEHARRHCIVREDML